ncbi:MAG: GTP-binding protein [Sinobacteraceae bacterium]|nr:GTP-binding protein [Nevskiaceae bacterium]
MPEPIPAHVVTGPLGSGKTTAIARLLADKPPEEDWVVLLNEFSDAGIDALTVASAARGAFDVRLVPGGCLCCAGEQDFRRNLQELVTQRRPQRILVEPSGLGHPAGIVEELLGWESTGQLQLAGIVALLDPLRLRDGGPARDSEAHAQVEIADALALSKADLADAADLARFEAFAAQLYPRKAWFGPLVEGRIPPVALEPRQASVARAAMPRSLRPALHQAERQPASPGHHEHELALGRFDEQVVADAEIAAANGLRREVRHLGRRAVRWVFPRAVAFSREPLMRLLAAAGAGSGSGAVADGPQRASGVLRLKGVFRVAEDEWLLVQPDAHGSVSVRPSSWRRDSRVELLLDGASADEPLAWDAAWLDAQQRR